MPRINSLVFVVGGVITPPIAQVAQAVLWPHTPLTPEVRLRLMGMDEALFTGALDAESYCQQAVDLAGAALSAAALATHIEGTLAPIPGISAVLAELAERYPLWLLVNFPRRWFDALMQRSDLLQYFTEERILMAPCFALANTSEALFTLLTSSGAFTAGRSLLVDDNPKRGMAAIRAGLDCALFVDLPRFRRDLSIWGLLPPLGNRGK